MSHTDGPWSTIEIQTMDLTQEEWLDKWRFVDKGTRCLCWPEGCLNKVGEGAFTLIGRDPICYPCAYKVLRVPKSEWLWVVSVEFT